MDVKLLLFKTTNFICDDVRSGTWATYSRLYHSFDNQTIETCTRTLEPMITDTDATNNTNTNNNDPTDSRNHRNQYNITREGMLDYCTNGQLTEVGAQHLNNKVFQFVSNLQTKQRSGPLTVGIYNDHVVETCDSTTDAIHHKYKMPLWIRLLANTIDGFSQCSSYNER